MKLTPQDVIWLMFKPHVDRHNKMNNIYCLIIDKDGKVNVSHWCGDKLIELEMSKDLDVIVSNMWLGISKPPHTYTFNLGDPEFENKVGELIGTCLRDHTEWMK